MALSWLLLGNKPKEHEMSDKYHSFRLPTRPFSPIDALNRSAAAKGSPGYAMATAHANYNGHSVSVSWNDYRQYWITEYYWGERVVLARGSFIECLNAASEYYKRGDRGANVNVSIPIGHIDEHSAIGECEAAGLVSGKGFQKDEPWWTWRHTLAAQSVRDYCFRGQIVIRFDWDLMQAAETEEAYKVALKAKYGSVYN